LRSPEVADVTSAEGAGRSGDIERRKRRMRQRKEAHRSLKASISDRHTERLYWQCPENGSETADEN
jgi:hypothetical protein